MLLNGERIVCVMIMRVKGTPRERASQQKDLPTEMDSKLTDSSFLSIYGLAGLRMDALMRKYGRGTAILCLSFCVCDVIYKVAMCGKSYTFVS